MLLSLCSLTAQVPSECTAPWRAAAPEMSLPFAPSYPEHTPHPLRNSEGEKNVWLIEPQQMSGVLTSLPHSGRPTTSQEKPDLARDAFAEVR